jgi:hypothetical protein
LKHISVYSIAQLCMKFAGDSEYAVSAEAVWIFVNPVAPELPYFPAHKMHFFPRKMWPKFDLFLMHRG